MSQVFYANWVVLMYFQFGLELNEMSVYYMRTKKYALDDKINVDGNLCLRSN